MRAVIFLGPTLPVSEARMILDAIYLPPAQQGDLISAVTTYHPDVVGLIDGMFMQSLAVWHKEILDTLARGIPVYGASSMGALRAAETAEFGMIGVGEVYRLYASGELTDDDEVALAHGSEETGYQKVSEPMVNVRATLRLALDEGILDESLFQKIVAIAKATYFPERTFPFIFHKAAADGVPDEVLARLKSFVAENYRDIKRSDAIALLETIRDLPEPLPKPLQSFTFTRSYYYQTLYDRDRTVRHGGVDVRLSAIANYVALHAPDFADLSFQALNRTLVVMFAQLLGAEVSREDVEQEKQRFRARHNLKTEEAFVTWLSRNDLGEAEFHELMRELALCRVLHRALLTKRHLDKGTKLVLDELRWQNHYEEWATRAAAQERVMQMSYPAFPRGAPRDISMQDLLANHTSQTACRIDIPIARWAEEAGFHTIDDLRIELLRAKLAREAAAAHPPVEE